MSFDRKAYRKKYYIEHKEQEKASGLKYYHENKVIAKERHRAWCQSNIEHTRKYFKDKYRNDINFKFKVALRSRFHKAVSRKTDCSIDLIGCSIEELRAYLESKFVDGMNWSNWSYLGWHIDHIKPLNSFDLNNREELKKAFHYTNLQPLWRIDNMKKSAKIYG